jgi:Flp pilus assembly pilin Flp
MMNFARRLWNDEAGFVVTVELILVATILVIGLVAGLQMLQTAVVGELVDTAQAFGAINQSWSYSGMDDAVGAGSGAMSFVDAADGADVTAQADALAGAGLAVTITPPATPAIANAGEDGGANQ